MSDVLSYAVNLIDGMSGPARAGAAEIRQLSGSLRSAKGALSGYQSQLGRAKALGDVDGYRKYSSLVDQSRRSVFGLAEQLEGLGPVSSEAATGLAEMSAAAGPWVAVAGAAIGVGVGLVTGLAALTFEALTFAEGATEAKERAVVLFDALGAGPNAGKRTLDMLDDLSARLPQTRDQLAGWAKQLEIVGITDLSQVQGQLHALASAQAEVGEEGASKYLDVLKRIQLAEDTHAKGLTLSTRQLKDFALTGARISDVARGMGLTTAELTAQLKRGTANAEQFGAALQAAVITRGAGPLEHLGLELSTVLTKGSEGFRRLFDSVDFTPLSSAMANIFAIFDDGPNHANIFKQGITGALNDIVTGLADLSEKAEFVFLTIEVAALRNKPLLDALWKVAKLDGYLFLDIVEKIARELGGVVDMASRVGSGLSAAKNAVDDTLGVDRSRASTPEEFDRRRGIREPAAFERGTPPTAPPNAEGGLVQRPAPGEVFASVAPGERIVPRGEPGNDNVQSAPNAAGGGGSTVHIERLELHVDAPHGVTDATAVTASALAIVLERLQLASGR